MIPSDPCNPHEKNPKTLHVQGYLTYAHPLGPPQGPRHRPTVGSRGGAVSYERGTPAPRGVRGEGKVDFWKLKVLKRVIGNYKVCFSSGRTASRYTLKDATREVAVKVELPPTNSSNSGPSALDANFSAHQLLCTPFDSSRAL